MGTPRAVKLHISAASPKAVKLHIFTASPRAIKTILHISAASSRAVKLHISAASPRAVELHLFAASPRAVKLHIFAASPRAVKLPLVVPWRAPLFLGMLHLFVTERRRPLSTRRCNTSACPPSALNLEPPHTCRCNTCVRPHPLPSHCQGIRNYLSTGCKWNELVQYICVLLNMCKYNLV